MNSVSKPVVRDAIPLDSVRRALVIKLRHHGDVLLTSPVFAVLKNHVPYAEVDGLVYADTAPMLEGHPAISQLFCIDRRWKRAGALAQLRAEYRLFQQLRRRRYDLVIHLTDHSRGAWLVRLLRPRYSVAPNDRSKGRTWLRSFTHLHANLTGPRHTVERHLDALRRIGIQPGADERALVLNPNEGEFARVDGLLRVQGVNPNTARIAHFHPASRWTFKCLSVAQNAHLIQALLARGLHVAITAAPDAGEMAMVEAVLATIGATTEPGPKVINLSGKLALRDVGALSRRASLFVGADSAPMHMAAAVGTPVVTWFGPSSETDWGPWQVRHSVVVSDAHPCRPCGKDGCGGGKISECLTALPLDRLTAAIDAQLAAGR